MSIRKFLVDGEPIKTPTVYKPVFATTSSEDTERTQDMILHNTVLGTVEGYDMTWNCLNSEDVAVILNSMMNKASFSFYHRCPLDVSGWRVGEFYAANYSLGAQRLQEDQELWSDLTINVRSINPI